MPTKPHVRTLTNSSVDILNAIRNTASINYRNYVPVATEDAEVIRMIGATIMDAPELQNEFLNALVNRIGKVVMTSKLYSNPWAMFKKGALDFGETVEEIFVDIAKAHEFDPSVAETEFAKREIPDVKATFHPMNYRKFYKQTVNEADLRRAFISADGVTDLIGKIIDSMYAGAAYDEFLAMKYLLARGIIQGMLYPVTATTITDEASGKKLTALIKAVSNKLTFNTNNYTLAGNYNFTPKNEQYLIMNATDDALMDVNVLASAFHMDKAEFMGHRIMVDGFGDLDNERLGELFKDDPTYEEIDTATQEVLNTIPAVLVDKDFFQIFDNLQYFDDFKNPQGMYWNYFFHVWETFSVSPYANAVVFLPAAPTVTKVAVEPTAITLGIGGSAGLKATVTTTNFAPQTVTWTSSNDKVVVDAGGNVKVLTGATGTATITATSVFDTSKSGTCTVTVKS